MPPLQPIVLFNHVNLDPLPLSGHPLIRWFTVQGGTVRQFGMDESGWKSASYDVVHSCFGWSATLGFTDAHCHLMGLGRVAQTVDLRDSASVDEALARMKPFAMTGVVRGRGWDQTLWGGQFPTRGQLDSMYPEAVIAVRRIDGHCVWTNSKTLRLAGVTAQTKDPVGGRILKDLRGEPTGILIDEAMSLVERVLPPVSLLENALAYEWGAREYLKAGFTCVHEAGVPQAWYEALRSHTHFPLRVFTMGEDAASWEDLISNGILRMDRPTSRIARTFAKIYLDGAFGSRGAALRTGYCDDPGNHGLLLFSDRDLQKLIQRFSGSGIGLAFHSIGDASIDQLIRVLSQTSFRGKIRIEHAQMLHEEHLPWLVRCGVHCSVQPSHAVSDSRWITSRVGADRLNAVHRLKSLDEAGVELSLGSDAPIEPMDLSTNLRSAVDRKGFQTHEQLSPQRLFAISLTEQGRGMGLDKELGAWSVGRWADVSFFEGPFWNHHPSQWNPRCTGVLVGGEQEYWGGKFKKPESEAKGSY